MPLTRKTARVPEPHSSREQEEEEPGAKRSKLEPIEAKAMEPGRPYQAFVEREARDYWQSLGGVGSLTKPTQEEIRAAAMPILGAALRRRTGWSPWTMAHNAVGCMIQHALEKAGKPPKPVRVRIKQCGLPGKSPCRTIWQFTIPWNDSYIRGDYVCLGSRITASDRIFPLVNQQRPGPGNGKDRPHLHIISLQFLHFSP